MSQGTDDAEQVSDFYDELMKRLPGIEAVGLGQLTQSYIMYVMYARANAAAQQHAIVLSKLSGQNQEIVDLAKAEAKSSE